MSAQYSLSQSAHACLIGQTWVVLDTRLDRYLCLEGRQSEFFGEIYSRGSPSSPDAVLFAERLCARGLLVKTTLPDSPSLHTGPVAKVQMAALPSGGLTSSTRLTDVFTLAHGMVRLGHLQEPKRRNLQRIIASVQGWKRKAARSNHRLSETALQRSQAFHDLAPWFFTAHDACFFRSLLLVYFLSRFGVSSDWTFGVRLSPFRAHCWVSAQGILLNEDLDIAAGFQPILTI